jgi:hypothetical protein
METIQSEVACCMRISAAEFESLSGTAKGKRKEEKKDTTVYELPHELILRVRK